MITDINRETLLTLIEQGAQVVDVLPEGEFMASHIPGAINIPLKNLNSAATSTLARAKPVVVY
ncbi:MAG: rhodanese-like domain-containing protein [Acidobacteria bacterium]|nr:rhodanese-like domain-containing protein [Acidobacteriota bacterium]